MKAMSNVIWFEPFKASNGKTISIPVWFEGESFTCCSF